MSHPAGAEGWINIYPRQFFWWGGETQSAYSKPHRQGRFKKKRSLGYKNFLYSLNSNSVFITENLVIFFGFLRFLFCFFCLLCCCCYFEAAIIDVKTSPQAKMREAYMDWRRIVCIILITYPYLVRTRLSTRKTVFFFLLSIKNIF